MHLHPASRKTTDLSRKPKRRILWSVTEQKVIWCCNHHIPEITGFMMITFQTNCLRRNSNPETKYVVESVLEDLVETFHAPAKSDAGLLKCPDNCIYMVVGLCRRFFHPRTFSLLVKMPYKKMKAFLHKSVLSKSAFLKKHTFSNHVPTLSEKLSDFFAKTFRRSCQNCILHVQTNILGFSIFSPKSGRNIV